ncbi:uncharacterized protein LOC122091943 [Macadamia integrifolia]|uniref:uncharacterized protein LOC122091943 n=1 Tax=Macadamia integrifolia TaxID=60698 RepID=UPI001C4ED51B|nr:uncharacterized protein LOC122091943 [Macadamia integrifolia]XP_042518136.1 uncharacterized protein LOC122091943 [Macadamia integrifolia]
MDSDYKNRGGSAYDSHIPMYRTTSTSSNTSTSTSHPQYGSSSLYPRVAQSGHSGIPPTARASPFHQSLAPSSASSGLGIRVQIKPEYRITPPPQLSQVRDVPRSTFQFDFEFEKRVLAEAEKENPNWSRLVMEHISSKPVESTPPLGSSATDPVVNKYIASGLSREAVPLAVANYGDNPTKVREFVNAYNLLREMGFSSTSVAEALAMYDNDTDKALAHFLNSS